MPYKTFGFTEEQILMRDSILGLLGRVLPDEMKLELDKTSTFPEAAFKAIAADGWLGLPIEAEYGGAEASNMDMAVFIEAMGYYHYGVRSAYMTTAIYGASHLRFHASEAQRKLMLPPLIAGELKMCIAYSEPDSGSDMAGIRTRAVRQGDNYVINGQKIYITNAHVSDWMVVAAKTDPDAGRRGLSLFLVDSKSSGLTIRNMDPLGSRTSLPNEVFFDDVELGEDALVGTEGGGWNQVTSELAFERSGPERIYSSILLLDGWLDYLKSQDHVSEASIILIGKFAAHLAVLRAMSLAITDQLTKGESPANEAALVKDLGTEIEQAIPTLIADALAAIPDAVVPDDLMKTLAYVTQMSPTFSLRGGTREILRGIIARGLGLR